MNPTQPISITWVSNAYVTMPIDNSEVGDRLIINVTTVKHASELFPLLSDCNFHTDLIIFDMDSLCITNDLDPFDIISTVSTLIKCTVSRTGPGKPIHRNPVLAVAVDSASDRSFIRLLTGTDIRGVVPHGPGFTLEDKVEAITELMSGRCYMPKKLLDGAKSKSTKQSDGIVLTTRQRQILSLIQERGASNKAIAKILQISESTVKLHITHILKKYGVKNRTQLALFSKKQFA